jgi:Mg2+ and Co2+ transporter CorA
MLDNKQNQLL